MKKMVSFCGRLSTYEGKGFSVLQLMSWMVAFGRETSLVGCYLAGEDISQRLSQVDAFARLGLDRHIGASLSILSQLKEIFFNGADAASLVRDGSVSVYSDKPGSISVRDSGPGMSLDVLLAVLFVPTESTKRVEASHSIGCMGVGALGALALLRSSDDSLTIQTCYRDEAGTLCAYELKVDSKLTATLVPIEVPSETGTVVTVSVKGLQNDLVLNRFRSDFRFVTSGVPRTGLDREHETLLEGDGFDLRIFPTPLEDRSRFSFVGFTKGLFTVGPFPFISLAINDISLDLKVPTEDLAVTEARDRFVLNQVLFEVFSELIEGLDRLCSFDEGRTILHVIRALDTLIESLSDETLESRYLSQLRVAFHRKVTDCLRTLKQGSGGVSVIPDSLSSLFSERKSLPDHLLEFKLWRSELDCKIVQNCENIDVTLAEIKVEREHPFYYHLDKGDSTSKASKRHPTLYLSSHLYQSLVDRPDELRVFLSLLKELFYDVIRSPFNLIDRSVVNIDAEEAVATPILSAFCAENGIAPGLSFLQGERVSYDSDVWMDRYSRLSLRPFGLVMSKTTGQVFHFYESGVVSDSCTFSYFDSEFELKAVDIHHCFYEKEFYCIFTESFLCLVKPDKEVLYIESSLAELRDPLATYFSPGNRFRHSRHVNILNGAVQISFETDSMVYRFLIFEADGYVLDLTYYNACFRQPRQKPDQHFYYTQESFFFWDPKLGGASLVQVEGDFSNTRFQMYADKFFVYLRSKHDLHASVESEADLYFLNGYEEGELVLQRYEGALSMDDGRQGVFPMGEVLGELDGVDVRYPFDLSVLTNICGLEGSRSATFKTIGRGRDTLSVVEIEGRIFNREPFRELAISYLERFVEEELRSPLQCDELSPKFHRRLKSDEVLNSFVTCTNRKGYFVFFFDDGRVLESRCNADTYRYYQRPSGEVLIYAKGDKSILAGVYLIHKDTRSIETLFQVNITLGNNGFTKVGDAARVRYKVSKGYVRPLALALYDSSTEREGVCGKLPIAYNHCIPTDDGEWLVQATSQLMLDECDDDTVALNLKHLENLGKEPSSYTHFLTLNSEAFRLFFPESDPTFYFDILGDIPVQYYEALEQVLLDSKSRLELLLKGLCRTVTYENKLTRFSDLYMVPESPSNKLLLSSVPIVSYLDFVRDLGSDNSWVVSQLFSDVSIPVSVPDPLLGIPCSSNTYSFFQLLSFGSGLSSVLSGEVGAVIPELDPGNLRSQVVHQMTRVVGPGESRWLEALYGLNARLCATPLAIQVTKNELAQCTDVVCEMGGHFSTWDDVISLFFNLGTSDSDHLLSFLYEQGELMVRFALEGSYYSLIFYRTPDSDPKSCDFEVKVDRVSGDAHSGTVSFSFNVPLDPAAEDSAADVYGEMFLKLEKLSVYQPEKVVFASLNSDNISGKAYRVLSGNSGFYLLESPHSLFLKNLQPVRAVEIKDLLRYAPVPVVRALLQRGISCSLPPSVSLRKDGRDFESGFALQPFGTLFAICLRYAYIRACFDGEIRLNTPHEDITVSKERLESSLAKAKQDVSACSVEDYFIFCVEQTCLFDFSKEAHFKELGETNLIRFFGVLSEKDEALDLSGLKSRLEARFPDLRRYINYAFSKFYSKSWTKTFETMDSFSPLGDVLFESSIRPDTQSGVMGVFLLQFAKKVIHSLGFSDTIKVGWSIVPLKSVGRLYLAYANADKQLIGLNPALHHLLISAVYANYGLLSKADDVTDLYVKIQEHLSEFVKTIVHELSHLQGFRAHDSAFYSKQAEIFALWLAGANTTIKHLLSEARSDYMSDYGAFPQQFPPVEEGRAHGLRDSLLFWVDAHSGEAGPAGSAEEAPVSDAMEVVAV